MRMICACGKEVFDKKLLNHEFERYNVKGQLIWATCFHGVVVLDRRTEDEFGNKMTAEEAEADFLQQIESVGKVSQSLADFANVSGVSLEAASDAAIRLGK